MRLCNGRRALIARFACCNLGPLGRVAAVLFFCFTVFYIRFRSTSNGSTLENSLRIDLALDARHCILAGMSKSFWAIIAVIIVIFGGILLFNNHKANAPSSSSSMATNHVEGEGNTGITLVEYGDYQCPYCGQFYPIVKAVQEKYNTQIHFQFRNLPLLQVHQNAFAAARAAEAADMQGKFWQMHDMLYENQNSWAQSSTPENAFAQYAGQLGLDVNKFKQDAASSKVNDVINADIAAFLKTGNDESTPTFFLDGKKIQPGYSVQEFSKIIDAQIASKHKS